MEKEVTPTDKVTLGEYKHIKEKLIKGLTFHQEAKQHKLIKNYSIQLINLLLPEMYDITENWKCLQRYIQTFIDECKDTKQPNITAKFEFRKTRPTRPGWLVKKGVSLQDLNRIFKI